MALCTLVTRHGTRYRVVPLGCILTRFSNAVNRRRPNFVRISRMNNGRAIENGCVQTNLRTNKEGKRRYLRRGKFFNLEIGETEVHNARGKIDEDENVI